MTVVVTGVTSFIGIYTARALLRTGDRVIGVVRPESHNLLKLTQAGITKDENFRLVRFDFDDLPEPEAGEEHYRAVLDEGIGSHIIDVWLHMSWDGVGSVGRSDNDMQIRNVQNAKKAYLMAKVLGARKFIFAGSQAEYGRGTHPRPWPVSAYGKGKLAFGRWATEQSLIDEVLHPDSMQFIHTRIYSVYGDGDHPTSLVNTVLRGAIAGDPFFLGPCTQMWNYLEVRDCARALTMLTHAADTRTDVYDIAGAVTEPLRRYVETMYRLAGGQGHLQFGMRGDNAEGAADMDPRTRKLEDLGFRQEISFEAGIGELVKKMRNH